jgi:hypothetical protein
VVSTSAASECEAARPANGNNQARSRADQSARRILLREHSGIGPGASENHPANGIVPWRTIADRVLAAVRSHLDAQRQANAGELIGEFCEIEIDSLRARARGRVDGRGLRRAGFETEQLARFRYRGDLAAEVLNDAHGLLDEHGVAGCRFAPGEVHRILHADAAVATKDKGLRQHGKGMPSGTEARAAAAST